MSKPTKKRDIHQEAFDSGMRRVAERVGLEIEQSARKPKPPLATFDAWVVPHHKQPCGYVIESPSNDRPHLFHEVEPAREFGKPIKVRVTVERIEP